MGGRDGRGSPPAPAHIPAVGRALPLLRCAPPSPRGCREESGVLCFPSSRALTPRMRLECNPEIAVAPGEEYYDLGDCCGVGGGKNPTVEAEESVTQVRDPLGAQYTRKS